MKRICKCHGTSGSCTYQTCWNTIDSFENIGFELLQLYRNATHVFKSNKDKARLKAKTRTKSLSQQLVYLQSSDNYCLRKNLNLDHGTRGRECKIGVPRDDPGHCNNLCCGRGSIMNVTKIDANCNCEYDWCCTMSCEKCFINRYKYYCK